MAELNFLSNAEVAVLLRIVNAAEGSRAFCDAVRPCFVAAETPSRPLASMFNDLRRMITETSTPPSSSQRRNILDTGLLRILTNSRKDVYFIANGSCWNVDREEVDLMLAAAIAWHGADKIRIVCPSPLPERSAVAAVLAAAPPWTSRLNITIHGNKIADDCPLSRVVSRIRPAELKLNAQGFAGDVSGFAIMQRVIQDLGSGHQGGECSQLSRLILDMSYGGCTDAAQRWTVPLPPVHTLSLYGFAPSMLSLGLGAAVDTTHLRKLVIRFRGNLGYLGLATAGVVQLLDRIEAGGLQELMLDMPFDASLVASIARHTQLRSLSMIIDQVPPSARPGLVALVPTLSRCEELDIVCYQSTREDPVIVPIVRAAPASLTSLRILTVEPDVFEAIRDLMARVTSSAQTPSLRSGSLRPPSLRSGGFQHLSPPSLQHINIHPFFTTTDSMLQLASAVRNCSSSLRTLRLRQPMSDENGFAELFRALITCRQLREITIDSPMLPNAPLYNDGYRHDYAFLRSIVTQITDSKRTTHPCWREDCVRCQAELLRAERAGEGVSLSQLQTSTAPPFLRRITVRNGGYGLKEMPELSRATNEIRRAHRLDRIVWEKISAEIIERQEERVQAEGRVQAEADQQRGMEGPRAKRRGPSGHRAERRCPEVTSPYLTPTAPRTKTAYLLPARALRHVGCYVGPETFVGLEVLFDKTPWPQTGL